MLSGVFARLCEAWWALVVSVSAHCLVEMNMYDGVVVDVGVEVDVELMSSLCY